MGDLPLWWLDAAGEVEFYRESRDTPHLAESWAVLKYCCSGQVRLECVTLSCGP